jgi:hypothetical protein
MITLFEKLEKAGLTKRHQLRPETVFNAPLSMLLDTLDAATAATIEPAQSYRPAIHSHCASIDLSGGRDECWGIECRVKAANELAQFAALYSNQVFIHNFLADFSPSWGHAPLEDDDDFRLALANDIQILLQLRPLIESGHIIVFSPPVTTCAYCYAKSLFGSQADLRLQRAITKLARNLNKSMKVELCLEDSEYALSFSTPEGLFRHSTHIEYFDTLPEPFAELPMLSRRITAGEKVVLSQKLMSRLGLHKDISDEVLISLRYQMSVADVVGASFLTSRRIDINVLNYISNDESIVRRNEIAEKYLSSMVPFAGDVPISKLLILRKREEEAFQRYRSALDAITKEAASQGTGLTVNGARAIYSDIIAPELARLDQIIAEAKRDLIKAPLAAVVGTAAIISFGVYSGMVPAELTAVASALGLTKTIYDTASQLVNLADVKSRIRPEKFYFLWRVMHASRKSRGGHRKI